jgi:outer membrane biosynthesis protein TonB
VTIAALAAGIGLGRPALSPGVALGLALLALFVVVSQLLNDPPAAVGRDFGHSIGIWLALVGSFLMVVGAVLAFADISLAVEARPRTAPPDEPQPEPEPPTRETPEQP